jgi:hypothetical protein
MTSRTKQNARIMDAALADIPTLRPVREAIDHGALDRIAAFAAERRAEMGEARWLELSKEFDA